VEEGLNFDSVVVVKVSGVKALIQLRGLTGVPGVTAKKSKIISAGAPL
jgi:hypothetical protein